VGWDIPVDNYCERIDATFWSEPLNALTNAAFIIAALAATIRYRRADLRDTYLVFLISIVALIGAGSFAFHTLATRGAVLLDVVPITVFVYGYLLLALRRFFDLKTISAVLALAAFLGASAALSALTPRNFLNGSSDYLPPLAALYVVGVLAPHDGAQRGVLMAALIFTVSLFFRTIDSAVCGAFPLGTHFVWHVLNAIVLYVLLITAIDARGAQINRAKSGEGLTAS